MTQPKKKIKDILDRFNLDVEDCGGHYEIKFIARKTGEQINVPIMGDILNYGDIVAFTNGTSPADLTKQDWINLLDQNGKRIKSF